MGKSGIKKVLAILLAILFVVSLTAVAVEAGQGHGGTHSILDMIIPVASAGHGGNAGHSGMIAASTNGHSNMAGLVSPMCHPVLK
jgi:hypothetical protein